MHGRGCEALLDTVTRGGVLQRGNGDDVNLMRERITVPGYVIAAAGACQCNQRENAAVKQVKHMKRAGKKWSKGSHDATWSASFVASLTAWGPSPEWIRKSLNYRDLAVDRPPPASSGVKRCTHRNTVTWSTSIPRSVRSSSTSR